MNMFRPLLAPREDPMSFEQFFQQLRYPLLCSPKLDGIRCIIKNGVALSRSGKALRSGQVQEEYGTAEFEHWDGELVVGDPASPDSCRKTTSHVMSFDKPGDVKFYAFDYTHPDWLHKKYWERLERLSHIKPHRIVYGDYQILTHRLIESYAQLLSYEEEQLEKGYEGVMMRGIDSPYKNGRATFNEGIIYKLKRFKEDEGRIIGLVEQLVNENAQERDELGYAKRSTSKEGLVPGGRLGTFVVDFNGMVVTVAPGNFDHSDREFIWENQEMFMGKLLKFRHFAHGVKDLPRFPRAVALRDEIDT
jgi:DNA ligase 1